MQWEDFNQFFTLQDSNNLSSPQFFDWGNDEWAFEENKLFENALAEVDLSSPDFFEKLAYRVPWKSMDEIKLHYQSLVQDLEMIESGCIPTPDYINDQKHDNVSKETPKRTMMKEPKKASINGQPRRRGVPWTEQEHQSFLMGLNKYGKGDWRSISRYYVISKTPTQVASHAQKYFRRLMSSTPPDRRRPSIHDIHTVNPIIPATTSSTTFDGLETMIMLNQPIHGTSSSSDDLYTLLNHSFNINGTMPFQAPATNITSHQYWG